MMRRKSAALLFLLPLLAATTARADRVDEIIRAEMARRHIPGASVAVIRNGRVVLERGYGLANVERSFRATARTKYQIASTTKVFTAAAVMLLVEDGKISLDEKAARYLAWLPSKYENVTVRQLLTHTSGVNRDLRTANEDDFTAEEFRRRLAAAPASFAPGERWEYANTGYILLGMIIESASGKPYGEFLEARVFGPLGMRDTKFLEPPAEARNRAAGYEWRENAYRRTVYFSGGFAAGGMVSSASDLAKLVLALDAGRLLRRESLEQLRTHARLSNDQPVRFTFRGEPTNFGLGWFLTTYRGRKMLTHGGVLSGFSSVVNRFTDDGVTIVVVCNSKEGERIAGQDRMGQAEVLAQRLAEVYVPGLSDKQAAPVK